MMMMGVSTSMDYWLNKPPTFFIHLFFFQFQISLVI